MLIHVVTGSRAEWGLLKPLVERLRECLEVEIIATGSHLSPYHGSDLKDIDPDYAVECQLASDTPTGVCKGIALAIADLGEFWNGCDKPDAVLILGDRWEILSAAIAAHVNRIPLIHIQGGETTGNYDNAFRHSITHMAQLHFTACEQYRERVIQLGAKPDTVFNVGALGCQGLTPRQGYKSTNRLLVVYHPATLVDEDYVQLFAALSERKEKLIFIKANADNGGVAINKAIDQFCKDYPRAESYLNLPRDEYLRLLANVDMIVGNSSSGIIEAPALGVPTVDIGARQKGRVRGKSVIWAEMEKEDILQCIRITPWASFDNPYGSGDVAGKIVRIIKSQLPKVSV